jgi:oligopeptide/dipeptide ABC transporter ATP-binding protein
MIAMALCCDPKLLIADEPTTALDVTIQAQILELLRELQRQKNMSILMITHDLGVVAENADNVVVMYASRIVETAEVGNLFEKPLHPYTQGLLKSLPRLGSRKERLDVIAGSVPNPVNFPTGCKFHPRCPIGKDKPRCRTEEPPLLEVSPGRCTACWFSEGYEEAYQRQESKT